MKSYFYILLLWLPLWLAGCSSVKVHYDRRADFTSYRTYAYEIRKPVIKGLDKAEARYMVEQIDAYLQRAGLQASRSHPDLLVGILLDFNERVDIYNPPYRWNHRRYRSKEGLVKIDLKDARTGKVVWTGRFYLRFAHKKELMQRLDKKLQRLFAQFPPMPQKGH